MVTLFYLQILLSNLLDLIESLRLYKEYICVINLYELLRPNDHIAAAMDRLYIIHFCDKQFFCYWAE